MALEVTLPFGVLNNIPPVSGIDDVEIRIPQEEDFPGLIQDSVEGALKATDAVEADVSAALAGSEILGDLPDDVADRVSDELFGGAGGVGEFIEELASAVASRVGAVDTEDIQVEIDGSLFSLQQDLDQAIAEALSQASLGDVPEFPSLEEIRAIVQEESPDPDIPEPPSADVIAETVESQLDLGAIDEIPTEGAIGSVVSDSLTESLEGLPSSALFFSPDEFIDSQLDRVTDGLVDDEARDRLNNAVDNL